MKSVSFNAKIEKFGEQGEKTGWSYISIAEATAQQLMPGNKKSFRVKGRLDSLPISKVALMPMGDGSFIMAVNASMRKKIGKEKGAILHVEIEVDAEPPPLSKELIECLNDEPAALKHFGSLAKSHQNYFTRWIESAKTEATKTKRIAAAVNALNKRKDFGQMIRDLKNDRKDLMG